MTFLAIDPGSEKSAWVYFDDATFGLRAFGLTDNEKLVNSILSRKFPSATHLSVEVFKSYGNVMGDSVLQACEWIGRFTQAAEIVGLETKRFPRKTVVRSLCENVRAGDKHVRQALIDRFPKTGKGNSPSIGTRANPGPLYGVTKDVWSALAVAVTDVDLRSLSSDDWLE